MWISNIQLISFSLTRDATLSTMQPHRQTYDEYTKPTEKYISQILES